MTWVQINVTGTSNLYVGAIYRPPDINDPEYLAQIDTCLSQIPDSTHIWLGVILKKEYLLDRKQHQKICHETDSVQSTFGHCQRQLSAADGNGTNSISENSANILDLFISNHSSLVTNVEVILGISDHDAVYIEASPRPHKTLQPQMKSLLL